MPLSESCMLFWDLKESSCAAWVQAWGSILAIVGSALGVWWAHHLQRRQRREEEFDAYTRLLESLFQLIGGLQRCADKIHRAEVVGEEGASDDDRRTMLVEVAALADAIKRIEVGRLDRYELVEAWLVGDALARKLLSSIEYYQGLEPISRLAQRTYLVSIAARCRTELNRRAKVLDDAIKARGGQPVASAVTNMLE